MKMRKGFTLVELLIVIIIIGILAAAMLLSSGSATDSATATKVLSNMRTIKAAALMYRGDHTGSFPSAVGDLDTYLGSSALDTSKYTLDTAKKIVTYNEPAVLTAAVINKLVDINKEKLLVKDDGTTPIATGDTTVSIRID